MRFLLTTTALASAIGLLAPACAYAQEQEEEIVVTAQKREQRLIDVPIAITAFSEEDLKDASFSELGDIGGLTANLLTLGTGSSTQQPVFVIRGVTSASGANSGFSPPLGVYVDEVYMGRDRAFNQILNDIAQIEVLKGPQGTLFGRNTTGGAISLTTRRPTNEFDFRGDLTYGVDNLVQVRSSIGGPLQEDVLLGQLSVVYRAQDGFLRNPTLDTYLNDSEESGGRGILVITPNSDLSITLSADYYNLDNNPAMETVASVLPTSFPVVPDDRVVYLDSPEYFTREMWGTAATVEYDFSNASLTSISAYRAFDSTQIDDSDGKPTFEFNTGRDEASELFTQEIRLASNGDQRLDWIVGGYYLWETVESQRLSTIGPGFPTILFATALGGILSPIPPGQFEQVTTTGNMDTTSIASFGHIDYDLADRLTLGVGVRYTHEEKEGFFEQSLDVLVPATLTLFPPPVIPPIALPGTVVPILFTPTAPTTREFDDDSWSYDVSLSYEFAPTTIGYARYSRGYKAGGFNLDVISPPNSIANQFAFEAESVDNYEIGLKTRLFENRLSIDASAFFLEFSDKQERIINLSSFFITNAAAAEISGAEIQFTARPTDQLTIFGNVGVLESEFTDFPASTTVPDLTGNELPFAPSLTGSLNAQYEFPLSENYQGMVRVGADYVSDFYTETDNSENTAQEEVTLWNARIGLERTDERYGLFLWGRNLTDETILGTGTDVITITTRSINRGLEWGVELSYDF